MSLDAEVRELTRRARAASFRTQELDRDTKDAWLLRCAERLEAARPRILEANAADVREAEAKGVARPLLGRLRIADAKWALMVEGVRDVAALPDPVGEISELRVRPSGVRVGRMRIPLGVVGIVYESRPNVTVDAAALCVKAGNAVILRGGSEAIRANLALGEELRAAARETGVPEDAVQVVPRTDRAAVDVLLRADDDIDLIIPRGGPGLIRKVRETSRIPVIAHDLGVCHVFVDASAEARTATRIVLSSKLRQMAVCNGLETLLVHRDAATTVMPELLKSLHENGIELRGCERTREIFGDARPAGEEDWSTEYLGPILAVRVVDGLDEAVEHIRAYGSSHTDVIVTERYRSAQEFVRRVGSSTVGVNCATGFADGYQLGLGAEIGISNTRIHAYGPMGLEGLTIQKFVVLGDGQILE